MRKSNLTGGIILVLFGLLFLAGNLGYVEPGFFYRLGQMWPLWLVVGGLLIMARNWPGLRFAAGAVVALMLLAAVVDPGFLDSMGGYRYWRHGGLWHMSSFWGLLFLAGAVWVLYNIFGRGRHETR
jgi:drug/metabolite transporter (DMT)-like permease